MADSMNGNGNGYAGFADRVLSRLRPLGRGRGQDKGAIKSAQSVGIYAVGRQSTDEEIADWEARLWHDQDDRVEPRAREWCQILLYCANEQHIAYHRDQRRWLARRAVPWRIRSTYNVMQKAADLRVAKLSENKPSVTVQATTLSRDDLDKTEAREQHWWYLWHRLGLHDRITKSRRWATKTGSGFLKVGWDPDAGPALPVTRQYPRLTTHSVPVTDDAGNPVLDAMGQPLLDSQQVEDGSTEMYVDAKGNPIGPVKDADPETGEERTLPPPPECDYYHEGNAFCDVRPPFSIRWDAYTDDLWDSWYVQDSEILPTTRILGLFPDAVDKLGRATPVNESAKAISWQGLIAPHAAAELQSWRPGSDRSRRHDRSPLDQEYEVRETWIFPRNDYVRRLWGPKGALLITVGGILMARRELPDWALTCCPFVQFVDLPEEGNHYAKSVLRDVLPLQDDINRSRSHQAEGMMLRSRLLLGAPQGHQMRVAVLGGLPGAFVTYRSREHKPERIDMGSADQSAEQFYEASLSAAADVARVNDASTGKLPSAGLAAKAIYALQYADERSISETSNLQDESLARLAKALDAVCQAEYTEERQIRVVGEDQSFLIDTSIGPDTYSVDVDFVFTPGSMLARQKEAIKNELLQLMQVGLVDQATVRKAFPAAVPDTFKQSFDLQYAKARRQLKAIMHGDAPQLAMDPWQDPAVVASVVQEFLLSVRFETLPQDRQQAVLLFWQTAVQAQSAQAPAQPGQPTPGQPMPAQPVPMAEPMAADPAAQLVMAGPQGLANDAEQAMAPPPEFGAPA